MSTTIYSGGLLVKDPDAVRVYAVNWDQEELAEDVIIVSSEFFITGPDDALTSDEEGLLTGNRSTTLRLTGGTLGAKYKVTNRIITSETPAQTIDASFTVRIGQK